MYKVVSALVAILILEGCGGSSSSNPTTPTTTEADKTYKTISGDVISVADGDTITVIDDKEQQYRVRLSCIDTPEKSQEFGDEPKEALIDLVEGKRVSIKYAEKDQYGRIIGDVKVDDTDVNLEQVKNGMAWVYRRYCKDCDFYDAEKSARDKNLGLWAMDNPTPPWEYRKDAQSAKEKDWSYLYSDSCPAD